MQCNAMQYDGMEWNEPLNQSTIPNAKKNSGPAHHVHANDMHPSNDPKNVARAAKDYTPVEREKLGLGSPNLSGKSKTYIPPLDRLLTLRLLVLFFLRLLILLLLRLLLLLQQRLLRPRRRLLNSDFRLPLVFN